MKYESNKIELVGDLRAHRLGAVRSRLLASVASGPTNLDLDMKDVTEADTAIVQLLLALRKELSSTNHSFRLFHVPESIRQIISFYGLDGLLIDAGVSYE